MSVDDRRAGAADTPLLGDRYRLVALLGRGGAGKVYEAVDIALGRTVAVKVFQDDGNPVGRYRFATEARLLAGLTHPGLVTIHDVCLDHDPPFLVMRHVNGPTLRDLLDRGPLEPRAVARVGARLADVLTHVHSHDIVHRDIKPSNVLVTDTGDCLLTDFGVARALGSAHLTATGEFVGTAAYLAPEQITDVDVGPPADIYALGLLLLECLTGRTEYTGTTVEAALARLNRPPRVPGTLPPPWRTLLTAMTAQDPAPRPDAARCAALLHAIADDRTATLASLPIPGPRLPRPRPVHAGLTALALTAACAITVSAASTTTPGRPAGEPQPASTSTAPAANVTEPATPHRGAEVAEPPATHHRDGPPPADRTTADDNPGKGNNKNKGSGKGKSGGKG